MFMLGVGHVNITELQRMSGLDNWTAGESIISTDYVLESNFSNLAAGLREFAVQLCGTPITVTKTTTSPVCVGARPLYTLTVTNTGATHQALDLVLRDTFPTTLGIPSCQTNCGSTCVGTVCSPDQHQYQTDGPDGKHCAARRAAIPVILIPDAECTERCNVVTHRITATTTRDHRSVRG